MRIRTLYIAGAIVTVLAVAGLEGLAWEAFESQQRTLEDNARIEALSTGIYQLNTLTHDVLSDYGERAVGQWRNRHHSLALLLQTDDTGTLAVLASYHAKAGEQFDRLVDLSRVGPTARWEEPWTYRAAPLAVRLRTLVDAMAGEADNLSAGNHERMLAGWQRLRSINMVVNGLMAGFLLVFGLAGAVRVIGPLMQTREGIRAFAAGDESFRFLRPAADEIGDVKAAFNQMASSLCQTMVSRNLLSVEVDERRRMEEALRRSEADLRAILDNMLDVFFRTGSDGQVIMVSRSVEWVTGFIQEEVVGAHIAGILFDPAGYQRMMETMTQSGTGVVDFELPARHREHGTIWVAASSHFRWDDKGDIVGIEGVFRSVEDRRAAEKALRAQAMLTQSLINASSDATMLFRLDGTLLAVNSVFADRFGTTPEGVIGRCLWDFFPPDVAEARKAAVARVVETGRAGNIVDRRGGLYLDNSIYPVPNQDGVIDQVAVYSRDVSERYEAETRIKRYITEIERSNAELEQFAYVASHDLREPLRMVTSYLSLIERRYGDSLDNDAKEFLAFARDGARRMDGLVLDLLEYSRIERRGEPMVPTPVEEVLATAMLHLSVAIDECGAQVGVENGDASPVVVADRSQVIRLFQNIIGNAVKYRAPDRPPEVLIAWKPLEGFWLFTIADNGIGIDTQYHDRIFGIFQRLHTREKYDGTGIGLAVCKKIVERHGGRIWLESVPGQGTTFFFTLPKAD
ncbi:MAG: ATP-binding protein [Actinomycetota bacterium]